MSQPIGPPALAGLQILLVEAEADTRRHLTIWFGQQGALVTAVATVAEGRSILARSRADLLICHIQTPDEAGYDFIRKVRSLPPWHGGQMAAIAVTASALDRPQALAAGYNEHRSEPVDPGQLLAVAGQLTGRIRGG